MTIYVDENVPQKITIRLRAEGYQVEYVTRRVEDKDILETAYKQNALLITSDKDFELSVQLLECRKLPAYLGVCESYLCVGQMCDKEKPMDDSDVLYHIEKLVDEEQSLMRLIEQSGLTEDQRAYVRQLEIYLDQCRDLLRQRRARRIAGLDPGDARLHDADNIEHFPQ